MAQQERPRTVREFQTMFDYIYTPANKRYTNADLVLRLSEESSVLMEFARKDYRHAFGAQCARIYSWVNAVATRYNIDLQNALWGKYPSVCPYCFCNKDCQCEAEHLDIPDKSAILRRLQMEKKSREPLLLSDHQKLHARLYEWQNERILPIQIASRVAEEIGEVSKEHRHQRIHELGLELADVISWIFALATRVKIVPFDQEVWGHYSFECSSCHQAPCVNQPL